MRDHTVVASRHADGRHDVHTEEDRGVSPEEEVVPEENHCKSRPYEWHDDEGEDTQCMDIFEFFFLHTMNIVQK